MKYQDISGLKVDELKTKLKEAKNDLFHLKMKNSLGQLGNPLEIRFLRKDIAKFKTAIRQKN